MEPVTQGQDMVFIPRGLVIVMTKALTAAESVGQ
jgi:hypothetical protein